MSLNMFKQSMRDVFSSAQHWILGRPLYWFYRARGYPHDAAYGAMKGAKWSLDGAAELANRIEEEDAKQLEFLKKQGLQPNDTFLDIGCGYLRGGAYIIDYLDKGRYTGIDISPEAIDLGKELLDDELLSEKEPNLLVNDNLKFNEFDRNQFDYVIAQSVFSHLRETEIDSCLANLQRVIDSDGRFYATFFNAAQNNYDHDPVIFTYEHGEMRSLANRNGWDIQFYDRDSYNHPGGQIMTEFIPQNSKMSKSS